ncbi:replication initiation factor, partial [Neisseria meningitidis]|nr:replication initiation factor [Neisseria meningitidis]
MEDEDFIRAASMLAEEVFGFGIYKESKGSGGRFYERCWLMGSEDVLYGRVHFGG